MAFLLFIFNKSHFLNVKNWCICQFLFFDRRNESDLRGDDHWRNYEIQYLVQYDFTIESVDCHSIHALFLDGNQPSQSRPSRDGFAV